MKRGFTLKKLLPRQHLTIGAGLATALVCSVVFSANAQTQKQMWEVIQKQQRQIEALTKKQSQTDKSVEATAAAVQEGAAETGWWNKTSLGGYGEIHYNGGDTDRIDIHRFVLNVNHEFSDSIRLYSELEIEHGLVGDGSDKPGEVEMEQAWIEFDISENTKAKAGIFIIPAGITNETHEPPTYYGVERNRVEKNIIPTTWWEAGAGLTYNTPNGFQIDVAAHSGLDVPNGTFLIRSGRQKVAEATARKPAYTGRLKYTGTPGVELAATIQHQTDITQGDVGDVKTTANLFTAHGIVTRNVAPNTAVTLKALYATWDVGGTAAAALGRDEQTGYYIEPSIRFSLGDSGDLGFYIRYGVDDNTAGNSVDTEQVQTAIGLNYWPHEHVVLKLDYVEPDPPSGSARNEMIRAGLGFQF